MSVKKNEQNKKVTQDEVAQYAGVTRSIVSYVLNNSDRSVAPETRKKILEAIEILGYRPNKYAQALMRGSYDGVAQRQIGIVINSEKVLLRPYYAEILAGIHSEAHERSYHIRFIRFFDELKDPILFNELIHPDEICGLILVSLDQSIVTTQDRLVIERIKERIDNIVAVEWSWEGIPSVNFDRQEAARTAVKHLSQRGYSRIIYIGEPDNRVAGFQQAQIDLGVVDIASLVVEAASDMRDGFEAVAKVIEEGKPFDAIFAGSDEVAIGILRYLNMKRISVPEKVAIISIDNIEMAEFTNPPLTTIDVQKTQMGRQAVQMVIAIHKGREKSVVNMTLPTSIIHRESC